MDIRKRWLIGIIPAAVCILVVGFCINRYFTPKIMYDIETYISNKENFEGKSGLLIFLIR